MTPSDAFLQAGFTLKNTQKDFFEWHQGCSHYYVWLIWITEEAWNQKFVDASTSLSNFLHQKYFRQPHITVLPAGFPQTASIDLKKLEDKCKSWSSFTLGLGVLSSFTSAPCFLLNDPDDALRDIRTGLREICADPNAEVSDSDYTPHLTVGIYNDVYAVEQIYPTIYKFAHTSHLQTIVDKISLARYRTDSIKGALESIADIQLGSGILTFRKQSDLFD